MAKNNKAWQKGRDKYIAEIKWKKHEINLIKNNWKQLSDRELKENLLPHRPYKAVTTKRQQLGYHRLPSHQIWTPEEIAILKENYLQYDQRQLQQLFFPNKTVKQIRNAKMSRGLKKPPVWTNEERAILIDHGANYKSGDMKKKFFPNKTPNQIAWMRKHLGVRRRKKVIKND